VSRRASLVLVILALSGCSSHEFRPEERLDPKTAVNVTIMAEPWVFARDVPMLAANARDYLSVGVVESNRAGSRAYWFGVFAWSTIDRSALPRPSPSARLPGIRLVWPDSTLELVPAGSASGPGLSEPVFVEPKAVVLEAWYPLSGEQLAQLGAATPIAIALIDETGQSTTYKKWQAHPGAMKEFLEATGN